MTSDRLPSTGGPRRFLIGVLAIGYGSFLAFVAFWPSPIDRPVSSLLQRALAELHERGVPSFVDYGFVESASNVLLFIPAGILFGLLVPLRWWPAALLLGPALSALIEFIQLHLLAERYASVYDIAANSIGATIGVLIAVVLRAVVAVRDEKVIARHEAAGVARG